MKEQPLQNTLDHLSRHPARLECLVADLVTNGMVDLAEVEFESVSTFARNYSPDIADARIVEYPDGKALRLATHREGLYDQLPYALFHRPEPYFPGQQLKRRLEESAAARERETAARRFFHPFEQEFFRTAVKCDLAERELTDPFTSPLRQNLLLEIWPHCTRVPARSLPLLSYVLPLAHKIAGRLDLMAACYRAVLLAPVALRYVAATTGSDRAVGSPAGGDTLGVDTCLGGVPVSDLPELEITIGPLERGRCPEFLADGPAAELLTLLNDCLVPYEVDVRTVLRFRPLGDELRLGEGTALDSRLGFTSRLIPSA
ncbi:hypothetical protein [Lewinella sp. IMCC34183]|uniref:hypothetical protein n=1 Tax=Lewinella sp. IMCC34183 TaxID=2248762 RepID=UPI000E276C0A|nr:hypothetical protein [Lewinella sp. IMCC34183]